MNIVICYSVDNSDYTFIDYSILYIKLFILIINMILKNDTLFNIWN